MNKKIEITLMIVGLFFAITSLFYKQFFPIIFIIAAIIFLMRSINTFKTSKKSTISNILLAIIFIIGIFLSIN